jgi:hypothetical protein
MKNIINQLLILALTAFLLLPAALFSQGMIVTPGATCKTTGAAYITLIDANLVNNGTITTSEGSSFTMKGSTARSIGGSASTTFEDIILDNANGLILTNSETVNGTLTFINGKITLGDNNLHLGTAANVSGSGSSNYVITNGTGALRQRVMNNATDVTYPVGLDTEYLPVTVQFTVGSTADDINVRVANGLYTAYNESGVPTGSLITDHAVQKTWFLEEAEPGGSNATVKLQWDADSETSGFDRSGCGLGHYTDGTWIYSMASAASGSSPFTQSLGELTSLSPFAVFSPSVKCSFNGTTFCAGSSLNVDYIASGGVWNTENVFTAELSDASGSFTSPQEIGINTTPVSGTIDAAIPAGSTDGSAYRIRMTSTNPSFTGDNNGTDLTIHELRDLSGHISYYNTANTPLTSDITINLYQDGDQVGSPFVVTEGTFTFSDLCPGDYELRITSAKTTEGSVNTTDAAQVNYWGANPYTIEKVRFYAGDVTGGTFFINSSDAQLIKSNFVYGTPFNKGENWTFWKAGSTISNNSNPVESYPQVTIPVGSNATPGIFGLCTGDFNRSFSASFEKASSSSLALVYSGNRQTGSNVEFDLPLLIVNATGIGAISLIMNFPNELVEILDVKMSNMGGGLEWTVRDGNELRIGWDTQNPVFPDAGTELLTLKLKTTAAFTLGQSLRFTLSDNLLNELADEFYHAIDNALLSVEVIDAASLGQDELPSANGLGLSIYPNPFNENTQFSYTLPFDGMLTIELNNTMGSPALVLMDEFQQAGNYTLPFYNENLKPGLYLVSMKLVGKDVIRSRTIKVIKK